jgi:hypothetical protein
MHPLSLFLSDKKPRRSLRVTGTSDNAPPTMSRAPFLLGSSVTYSLLHQRNILTAATRAPVGWVGERSATIACPVGVAVQGEVGRGGNARGAPAGRPGGDHVATTMPAMKMSSSWKEEEQQEDSGDAPLVLFSASSSSSWISWSRQSALQNAFSPLQHHATKIGENCGRIIRCRVFSSAGWNGRACALLTDGSVNHCSAWNRL